MGSCYSEPGEMRKQAILSYDYGAHGIPGWSNVSGSTMLIGIIHQGLPPFL